MRRKVIEQIMNEIDDELVVCNIGFPSRELYDIDDRKENFYMIGSMGLASSIGFGLALARPDKKVVIIDGDGSLLMNMGSLVTVFATSPSNLTWIVIDNEAYGSTGNQETYSKVTDISKIAQSVGFKNVYTSELFIKEAINRDECTFISIKTDAGNSDAPIIDISPITIKERFMDSLK